MSMTKTCFSYPPMAKRFGLSGHGLIENIGFSPTLLAKIFLGVAPERSQNVMRPSNDPVMNCVGEWPHEKHAVFSNVIVFAAEIVADDNGLLRFAGTWKIRVVLSPNEAAKNDPFSC